MKTSLAALEPQSKAVWRLFRPSFGLMHNALSREAVTLQGEGASEAAA